MLATSSSEDDLPVLTDAIGAGDAVDYVVSKSDVEKSKPAPDIFKAALDALDLDPGRTLRHRRVRRRRRAARPVRHQPPGQAPRRLKSAFVALLGTVIGAHLSGIIALRLQQTGHPSG